MQIRTWVPALAFLALGTVVVVTLARFEERVQRAEQTIREVLALRETDFLVLTAEGGHPRVFYKNPGEPDAEFFRRARRDLELRGSDNYICSVFDGCQPGGFSAELCTYCPNGNEDPACIARHANQKALFCAEFNCTSGCD